MAVNLREPGALAPIAGARWASVDAAIKKPGGDDMALLVLDEGATVAGVFTRNVFAAAPVVLARRHMAAACAARPVDQQRQRECRYRQARAKPMRSSAVGRVADSLGVAAEQVLPFSTGVIGQMLPMSRIEPAIPRLAEAPAEDGWLAAARAIMTTDTVPKGFSRRVELDEGTVTLTGISKGSGMIRPDMATMLAFIATDATVPAADLDAALREAVNASFNSITVDGDTSTNDAAMLCATGAGMAVDRRQARVGRLRRRTA